MSYEVSQRFFFDAAHTLERDIERESSAGVHVHTYQAELAVAGEPDASGRVADTKRPSDNEPPLATAKSWNEPS